jgi:hypothetical protein
LADLAAAHISNIDYPGTPRGRTLHGRTLHADNAAALKTSPL